MSDWADEKAREWLDKYDPDIWHHRYSLAALLREIREEAYDSGYDAGQEARRRWDEEM